MHQLQFLVDKIYGAATGTYAAHTLRHLVGGAAATLSIGLLAMPDGKWMIGQIE